MIYLNKIGFMNFQAFGNRMEWVQLDSTPLTRIKGVNKDTGDTGESSNGASKSSIFNAITFACYGEGVDKVKTDDFINLVNGKKLLVELHFTKNKKTGIIRRGRKPNALELEYDGESLSLDSMKNTQQAIITMLGMSYDVFMLTCYMSPNRRTFFDMDGPTQRSVMEQMLGLDVLAARAEAVRRMSSEAKTDVKVTERDVEHIVRMVDRTETSLASLITKSSEFEDDKERKLEQAKSNLRRLSGIDFEKILEEFENKAKANTARTEIRHQADKATGELEILKDSLKKTESLAEEINKTRALSEGFQDKKDKKLLSLREERGDITVKSVEESIKAKEVTKERENLEWKIKSCRDKIVSEEERLDEIDKDIVAHEGGTCHVCGSDFADEEALGKLLKKKVASENNISALKADEEDLSGQLNDIKVEDVDHYPEDSLSALHELLRDIESIEAEILRVEESTNQNEDHLSRLLDEMATRPTQTEDEEKIKELRSLLEEYKEDVRSIDAQVFETGEYSSPSEVTRDQQEVSNLKTTIGHIDSTANPYLSQIEEANKLKEQNRQELENAEENLEEHKKIETHCGYLVKLLTDSKSFVRRRIIEDYIPYINKRILERSTEMGLTHVCEMQSDLTIEILYMNRPVPYALMSRGEKLRLNIATTMAFRDAIGMLGNGINMALVDEYLDSALDGFGIRTATKLITGCAENVFLITHRDDIGDDDDTVLTVTKENGFATIS